MPAARSPGWREPTADESADYSRDMADEFSDDDQESDDVGAKMLRHVEGTLSIARDGNYVQSIELRNERTIRPIFSVKIKRFLTHMQFGPADGVGPIVPLSVEVEVKGRAALLVNIDERESVHFTGYEWTGT
jgi:hypothetical protein